MQYVTICQSSNCQSFDCFRAKWWAGLAWLFLHCAYMSGNADVHHIQFPMFLPRIFGWYASQNGANFRYLQVLRSKKYIIIKIFHTKTIELQHRGAECTKEGMDESNVWDFWDGFLVWKLSLFWIKKRCQTQKLVPDQQIMSFGNWDYFFSLNTYVSILNVSKVHALW